MCCHTLCIDHTSVITILNSVSEVKIKTCVARSLVFLPIDRLIISQGSLFFCSRSHFLFRSFACNHVVFNRFSGFNRQVCTSTVTACRSAFHKACTSYYTPLQLGYSLFQCIPRLGQQSKDLLEMTNEK